MNPIKDRQPISRFSFRGSPAPAPGTALVYRLQNGGLVPTTSPFTYGELLWRRPGEYFVVDVSKHTDSFTGTLPSCSLTLEFTFTASYEWRVSDPATVVREAADDAQALCRQRLLDELPTITRGFKPLEVMDAESRLNDMFHGKALDLEEGIRMTVSRIGLRLPREHHDAATTLDVNPLKARVEEALQENRIKLHKRNVEAYMEVLEQGDNGTIANLLASDPESAREVAAMTIDRSNTRRAAVIELAKTMAEKEMFPSGQAAKFVDATTRALVETLEPPGPTKGSIEAGERRALDAEGPKGAKTEEDGD
ncbi:hypothetical protein [Glycomyces buryatensis]|uniref:Band 7 domain-containing protein n=1 Tax=Glycomyces buryatensis TaxID=2570927 RepID=A0A4S8QG42_9ACTN|nr:hypothetical protein [Glycomyces buryatensis]THV42122.1 hypothetical protein FAB82_07725 [Glycomyces buryatensis]